MRRSAVAIALAVGLPLYSPSRRTSCSAPPPPPAYDGDVPLPPPPSGTRALPQLDAQLPPAPPRGAVAPVGAFQGGAIGEAPIAPGRSAAAPPGRDGRPLALRDGERRRGPVRRQAARRRPREPGVLLYFGARADGLWSEGFGKAARLRLRMFTGGETEVYLASDGEIEGAFMIGRREFRFVLGRVEVGRYPALGVQVLAQLATLPCFEELAAAPRRHDAPLLLRVAGGGVVRPLPRRRSSSTRPNGRRGRTSRSRRARGGCAGRCSCRRPCCSRYRAT